MSVHWHSKQQRPLLHVQQQQQQQLQLPYQQQTQTHSALALMGSSNMCLPCQNRECCQQVLLQQQQTKQGHRLQRQMMQLQSRDGA
jgi:hypothetical protein